ncbi:protein of unknown function [uncultured Woeseiaceae bacterium]|uniref:Uncharacterized protein n=1 Tax=uncultured Woeseiaceae bacterium TaxID=1983305 RepID=A0A7D9D2A0_9GAMM|nr:protein of unknown function [uncultured Woeseiaceae bacterium]
MGNDEYEIMDDDQYGGLTQHEKEVHIRDLGVRKSMAIKALNEIIKSLAKKGYKTDIDVHFQDDTKTQVQIFSDTKIEGFPQTIPGSKYPQIVDVTITCVFH